MSVIDVNAAGSATGGREPRVRELAREAASLMAFSASASLAVFLVVLLGFWLGR